MENAEESKGGSPENDSSPSNPPRKKSQNKGIARKKSNSVTEDESSVKYFTSDGQIPVEVLSIMASKMIDTVMHNYESPKIEATPSASATRRKKSKASIQKSDSKPGDKENVNVSLSFQKLAKLNECVGCDWAHNYHPCLLSNSKDKNKCKEEMKRKGYHYEDPKQMCANNQGTPIKTTDASSTEANKKLPPSKTQSKQSIKPKSLPVKSATALEDGKKLKITQSKQKQNQDADKPKTTPSKLNQSSTLDVSRPKTTPSSTKSQVAKPTTRKPTRVNFENKPSKVTIVEPKTKPSKSTVVAQDNVRPTSSRLVGTPTLEFLNKLTSKASQTNKTAKAGMGDRLVASVPVSTRESRTRFNPRQPSPSATHLPPTTVSISELKCKKFDPVTADCICETASTSKIMKPSKSTVKKVNEVEELVNEGKTPACEWQKNYHPCDKPNTKCDKTGDKELCKVWKKGKSEADALKSTKSSCKSVADPNNTLVTTPSEKAYIDKVVRTAVKLAKKGIVGNCKKPRRKSRKELESGASSFATTVTVSSAFSQANNLVENAIYGATHQARPTKQSKSNKLAPGTSVPLAECSPKKK